MNLATATYELAEAHRDLEAACAGDSLGILVFAWTKWNAAREKYQALLLEDVNA